MTDDKDIQEFLHHIYLQNLYAFRLCGLQYDLLDDWQKSIVDKTVKRREDHGHG